MSRLQEQAEKAWKVLSNLEEYGYCAEDCEDCPKSAVSEFRCVDMGALQRWLHTNGFPASRPHVYTVAELSKQIIKGRKLDCLEQWIAQNVEAVTCPGCGKHTLYRERRMECSKCKSIYPADKWATGESCECGETNASYYGIELINMLGQLEYQICQTPGCEWGHDCWPLTVQELAGAAQVLADEQWAAARTCPACGEASGDDQKDGVHLPIKSCECGWHR